MRWSGDKECFINKNTDLNKSAIPILLSKTYEHKTSFFKDLIQDDFMIAVLYYEDNLSEESVRRFMSKDIFLKIKSMCQ